jgi:hypothetical protein
VVERMAIPAYCLDSVGGLPSVVVVADGAAGDSADPNEESF